jgi:hypothetical protein
VLGSAVIVSPNPMAAMLRDRAILLLLLSLTATATASGQREERAENFRAIAGEARPRYDRFARDISFRLPDAQVEATNRRQSLTLIFVAGRKPDVLGSLQTYGRLSFVMPDSTGPASGFLTTLADERKPDRSIGQSVVWEDGRRAYVKHISGWSLDKLRGAKRVEVQLPNGIEATLPTGFLERGMRIMMALEDSAFAAWALAQASSLASETGRAPESPTPSFSNNNPRGSDHEGRQASVGSQGQSERWLLVAAPPESDIVARIDTASLVRSDSGYVIAWEDQFFPRGQVGMGANGSRIVVGRRLARAEYDCRQGRFRVLTLVEYGQMGEYLSTSTLPALPWMDHPPGSLGEAVLNAVCRASRASARR